MAHVVRLTIVLFALPATRQVVAQADAVPRELLDALLRQFGGPRGINVQLLVGRFPDGFAPRVDLRDGAQILGSFVFPGSELVVITSPLTPDSALARLSRQITALGWAPPRPRRGFLPATPSEPTIYCQHDRTLNIRATALAAGGSELSMTRHPGLGPPCGKDADTDNSRDLPTLIDPIGNGPLDMCYERPAMGPSTSTSTMTTIRTALPPDAILGHYGRQLEAQGWTPSTPTPKPAVLTWVRTDSTGRKRETRLEVTGNARTPNCYSVDLTVSLFPRQ